jgi:hypothetical protein
MGCGALQISQGINPSVVRTNLASRIVKAAADLELRQPAIPEYFGLQF